MRLLGSLAAILTALSSTALAQVERVQIDQSAFSLGTLEPSEGALNSNLWQGAERNAVSDLLVTVPTNFDEPLHRELLRRVLLSPGEGPIGADNDLAGQKLMKASEAGWYRDAASLASLAPSTSGDATLSRIIAYQELMDGQVDTACARGEGLQGAGRAAPFWIKLRYICYVRAGETSAADLTLNLLRRQDALSPAEIDRYAGFGDGDPVGLPTGEISVFDWVMMRAQGVPVDASFMDRTTPGLNVAIARSTDVDPTLREQAILRALREKTMDADEAIEILDMIGTSELAGDLLTLTAVVPGSLEYADALGAALVRGGTDYDAFEARALLFADYLENATPVTNFAPHATEISLASMIAGKAELAEPWIVALAADQTSPEAFARAERLVQLYSLVDVRAADRVGTFLGMSNASLDPVIFDPINANPVVPVASLVAAALPAAEAGSQGPAALVYLASVATVDDEQGGIRDAVKIWARDRADIRWMDQMAAFRGEVALLLSEPAPAIGVAPQPVAVPAN